MKVRTAKELAALLLLWALLLTAWRSHGAVTPAPPSGGGGSSSSSIAIYLTNSSPAISGNYQNVFGPVSDSTQPNRVKNGALSAGAAFSGIYSSQFSGSGSALSELPPRGNEVWDGKRKPFFVIATRHNNIYTSCTVTTVTNGVNAFVTNGYVAVWTNLGINVAFCMEDGWATNYRTANGYIGWNSNRFGTMVNGNGDQITNLTYYLRTNGLETWVMQYATALVPPPAHWPAATYSTTFTTAADGGNSEWDGFGSNPFGANEYNISMNPESLHRDISSFYANGISGVVFQNVNSPNSGYYNQVAAVSSYAAINPYFINVGMPASALPDGSWVPSYAVGFGERPKAIHSMFTGTMTEPGPWDPKHANNYNALVAQSNNTITEPDGTKMVDWLMGQIKFQSQFFTNAYGYCHTIIAGDGWTPSGYGYADWYTYFAAMGFFKINPYLMGADDSASGYSYAPTTAFGVLATNRNWIALNQDNISTPPTAILLRTNESIWVRTMENGNKLVFMENCNPALTTNLTVTWKDLGIASNSLAYAIDVITNAYLGVFTNSITRNVPIAASFLFMVGVPPSVNPTTNWGQMYSDATGNVIITSTNFGRAISIFANGSGVFIGTNALPPGNLSAALSVQAPNLGGSEAAISLYDATGNKYDLIRDGGTGIMKLIGAQANQFTGFGVGSTGAGADALFFQVSGGGFLFPTNPIAGWATAPLTRGGIQDVNSNGYTYRQISGPANNTWVDTNGFAVVKSSFVTGDTGNSTATFGSPTVDKNVFLVNGRKYRFTYTLFFTESQTAEGVKVDFNGGGATATNFRVHGELVTDTGTITTLAAATSTTLAGVINVAATATANQQCFKFEGTIEPSASGTFIPRVAQNSHTTGTITSLRGSNLVVTECY